MSEPLALIKGQRLKLAQLGLKSNITLKTTIEGPRQSQFLAFYLNENGHYLADTSILTPNAPKSADGALALSQEDLHQAQLQIHFDQIDNKATTVLIILTFGEHTGCLLENAGDIRQGTMTIEHEGQVFARFSFTATDFQGEKALVMARVYRRQGEWRLAVEGNGFRAGLRGVAQQFHIPENAIVPQPPTTNTPCTHPNPGQSTPPEPATGNEDGDGSFSLPLAKPLLLPKNWPAATTPGVPEGLVPGVGFILAQHPDGSQSSGTGFVISPGGFLLTCYHVVEGTARMAIALGNGEQERPLMFLKGDAARDVALCWLADGNGSPHWLPLAEQGDGTGLGTDVGLLAYPLGFNLGVSVTYSQGIVNSLRENGPKKVLQIDAGAAPGSSGGPVFRRKDGKVIGMLQGGVDHQHGMLINLAWDIQGFWELPWQQQTY